MEEHRGVDEYEKVLNYEEIRRKELSRVEILLALVKINEVHPYFHS